MRQAKVRDCLAGMSKDCSVPPPREAVTGRLLKTGELPGYGIVPPVVPGYTAPTLDFKGRPLAGTISLLFGSRTSFGTTHSVGV